MAIDITKISAEEALKQLGNDDWHIKHSLRDNPEFMLSKTWRQSVLDSMASLFVRWVIAGRIFEIHHDNDPAWDRSGSSKQSTVDPLLLLVKHETIGEWMEEEYTGNSVASYTSRMGLFWDTYSDEAQNHIQAEVFYFLEKSFKDAYSLTEKEEVWDHPDWNEWEEIDIYLQHILIIWVSALSTKTIWSDHESRVRAQIQAETYQYHKEAMIVGEHRQLAAQCWQQHFQDMIDKRIEAPQFEEWHLENRLRQVLLDADPLTVQAIASVGLPADFSNSVKLRVKRIASEAMA